MARVSSIYSIASPIAVSVYSSKDVLKGCRDRNRSCRTSRKSAALDLCVTSHREILGSRRALLPSLYILLHDNVGRTPEGAASFGMSSDVEAEVGLTVPRASHDCAWPGLFTVPERLV